MCVARAERSGAKGDECRANSQCRSGLACSTRGRRHNTSRCIKKVTTVGGPCGAPYDKCAWDQGLVCARGKCARRVLSRGALCDLAMGPSCVAGTKCVNKRVAADATGAKVLPSRCLVPCAVGQACTGRLDACAVFTAKCEAGKRVADGNWQG